MAVSDTEEGPEWTRQQSADIRAPLRAEATATVANATALRRQFRDWLALDLPAHLVGDLVLAVYEAIANAAEHAYVQHRPGSMQLEAHRAADHILVAVSDQGRWQTTAGDGFRGRGIQLMHLLTHHIHTRCDHRGTVVHLRVELSPLTRAS